MPLIWQILIVLLVLWIVVYMVARWLFVRDTRRAAWAASFATVIPSLIAAYIWRFDYYDDHWSTCQVTAKTPDASGGGVISTSNCGELSVRDTWNRESNFTETWDVIAVGKDYDFRLAGARWDLKVVNWYPNIIDMKPGSK